MIKKTDLKEFTIRELESFSEVQAHTIRMWERRYSMMKPRRSVGSRRLYSSAQLRHFLNIALLAKQGVKVSRLALMDEEDIDSALRSLCHDDVIIGKAINTLICFMFSRDIDEFEYVLDSCVHQFGIDITIDKIIVPFLKKVNILSYEESSNEVHFVVTAVRKKIIYGLETIVPSAYNPAYALLFLPENEHYDLILLYTTYKLKHMGLRTLYLGTNISLENVKLITREKKPRFLITYITPKLKPELHNYHALLELHDSPIDLLLIKPGHHNFESLAAPCVHLVHYNDVEQAIARFFSRDI